MVSIEVMMIGSPVRIGGEIDAVITGVLIRDKNMLQYECSWWDGNTHNCKWLAQCEVERADRTAGMSIGFRK